MTQGSGSALPAGTVTFLFTDIEGSTRLVKQLRDAYPGVLAGHREILRRVFAEHGGHEIDAQGDEFFVAFRRAKHAVAAAAAAQQSLRDASWPDCAELRVRIGIHTGEAEPEDGRYHGVAVHRAARIGAAAHGGQIVLSQTTHDLLQDEEADLGGLALRDLGLQRLRGLDRPVRLYQLDVEGAPTRFPRLRGVESEGQSRTRRRTLLAGALAGVIAAAVAIPIFALGGGTFRSPAAPFAPNAVAVIDPANGKIVDRVAVGSSPGAIAAGDDGIWVANQDDNTVSHIDPGTRQVVRVVPLDGTPTGLAAANGLVWAATGNTETGNVYRISAQYNRVSGVAHVPVELYLLHTFGARTVVARRDEVWVANLDATVLRIDPKTNRAHDKVVIGGGHAPGIAIGFGSIWVGTDNLHELDRIDLATAAVIARVPVCEGPSNIAIGAGAVWVACRQSDRVVRIDPTTNEAVRQIRVGRHPLGIVVADDAVWVANSRDGTISRIDPRTNAVRNLPIGNSPTGIAAARGRLWVTVSAAPFANRSAAELAAAGGVARVDFFRPDFTADPALAYDSYSSQVLQATCAKLVNYADRPGTKLVPEVARALPVVSDAGKTYTFAIRPGFRFSPPSNAPVTAATLKYSIERTLAKPMRSVLVSLGYANDIVGAKAYEAGRTAHISGIQARGSTLTLRLERPVPDLLTKLALPFFCAVPVGTPSDPKGLPTIPSAGPYYLVSHTPGRSAVLRRNPNYHGPRPHRLAEIDYALDVGNQASQADVEAGRADYAVAPLSGLDRLRSRYGAGRRPRRLYESPSIFVAYIALNASRPLFADVERRRAVGFALNRRALARIGGPAMPQPLIPTENFLPPGVPGYRATHFFPLTPDLRAARRLAGPTRRRAVLYACEEPPCLQLIAELQRDLAAIGIDVEVHKFAFSVLIARIQKRGAPYDLTMFPWAPDYLDPSGSLNLLFGGDTIGANQNTNASYLNDPRVDTQLAAAGRLTGEARYRAYARLASDLERNVVPAVAYGVLPAPELFSGRMGCQVFQALYAATDLATLCLRR